MDYLSMDESFSGIISSRHNNRPFLGIAVDAFLNAVDHQIKPGMRSNDAIFCYIETEAALQRSLFVGKRKCKLNKRYPYKPWNNF